MTKGRTVVVDVEPALTANELRQIVRAIDPTAFVVPGRVVRRAIKHICELPKVVFRIPHRLVFTMKGSEALEVINRDELGLEPDEPVPPTIILLAEPDPDKLAGRPRKAILRDYWRRLFHARIDVELARRFEDGSINPVGLRERIRRIDSSAFEEARSVLDTDGLLLPPRGDRSVYIEFAAVYLGLRAFSDHLIPRFFPAIRDYESVDRMLAEDLDAEEIQTATRLPGAADTWREAITEPDEPVPVEAESNSSEAPSGPRYRRLMAKAELASGRGNLVRAAILRTQAARLAGSSLAGQARSSARAATDRLASRLKAALGFDEACLREWRKALLAPLERSSRGFWMPEARLLYDFQKVCLDHERPVFAVNLMGWLFTLGRRPIKRRLPHHQETLMTQHLRSASKNLASSRLPEGERGRFTRLLSEAVHHAENRLRDRFRPEIGRVLEQTGFEARNLPERVSLQKLNEELLDRVVHRGFLSMGDLRDAVSRNNRKLPDLSGPVEFVFGDRLLRADRGLARAMDGIYRRGEIYLRFLQRMSALAFGTRMGRLLTRYLAMPYGGAYFALEFLQHVVGPLSHFLTGQEIELIDPIAIAIDGTVAVGLINSSRFRGMFAESLGRLFGLVHDLIFAVPNWLMSRPWIRRLFDSKAFSRFWRGVLVPGLLASLVWAVQSPEWSRSQSLIASATVFLATCLALTTRAGRDLEEMAVDSVGRVWHSLIYNLLPGLFHLIMEIFARVMEAVERVLYTVDEWLRFRGGQGNSSLVAKAILGLAWGVLAYVVRFFITLLIEPQINPIKHFPVVTVSAKILVTQVARINAVLETVLPPDQAKVLSGMILLLLPGVFGFLVWELKENWRLYEANRPKTLRPVVIGHHGETMARLLKPGFNSGTVPKVFARIRRAERKALRTGRAKQVRKQLVHLHAVEEEVRHFIDRDFLTLLLQGRAMASIPLAIGEVVPSAKRFLIEIVRPGKTGPNLWLAIEEHSGWLVASIADPGWLAELSPEARDSLEAALAGLYKMAGVDLVREPIERALAPESPRYDFREPGLVVWPDDSSEVEVSYLLKPDPAGSPLVTIDESSDPAYNSFLRIEPTRLLFSRAELTWKEWVETWEHEKSGSAPTLRLTRDLELLPDRNPAPEISAEDQVDAEVRG